MPDAAGTHVTTTCQGWLVEAKSREEALGHSVRVRDEINTFIEQLPDALFTETGDPR